MRKMRILSKLGIGTIAIITALSLTACGNSASSSNSSSETEATVSKTADGLYASQHKVTDTPEWIKALPSAKDKNVDQLFVVAGFGMDKSTATVSFNERDKEGNWKQILSTPAFVGRDGLIPDKDHREGVSASTPIGVYHFNKAFGIADDPGCVMDYTKVTDKTYWSGDFNYKYNQMIEDISEHPDLDMDNSEHIVDYDYQYQYCLNISFNEEGTANRGSAIFLHCIGPVKPYTGGCVAVPENIMKQIMQKATDKCVVVIDTLENLKGNNDVDW